MKTKSMFFCVIAMMSISGGLVYAQDDVPLPPGYGGGINNPVPPLPPGYGGQMGMGGGMMPVRSPMGAAMPANEDLAGMGARCLLNISCDPSILRLDERMMRHLWFSTGVLNKAYREVLADANCPMGLDVGSGDISRIDNTSNIMQYSAGISQMGGNEKEVLSLAVNNLKMALTNMADQERHRLMGQLEQTFRRCDEMEKQVAQMQEQIRGITREGVTNRQDVQKKIVDLRDSLADIDMNIQYAEVRIKEFSNQKGEVKSAVVTALATEPVIEEIKQIVKGAEEFVVLTEQLVSSGQAPADRLQEAKEKLTRAKIELAKRIEEVRDKAGQKQLADLDGRISDMASNISKLKLTKDYKLSDYNRAMKRLEMCDELELLEMKLDAAKRSFHEMLNLREDLNTRLQMQQSLSVSVIGLE